MRYYHWAAEPVKLQSRNYLQSGHPKPNGLWFDVNGKWKEWCEAAQFQLEGLRYRHRLTLLDPSRILFLKKVQDVDAFTKEYGRDLSGHIQLMQSEDENGEFARKYGQDIFGEICRQFGNYILWDEVAKKYSGIIISPYSHARTLTYMWYYGWGCASGCIWDTGIIRLGRPVEQPEIQCIDAPTELQ